MKTFGIVVVIIALIAGAFALFGASVTFGWNFFLCDVFELPKLEYKQGLKVALGLFFIFAPLLTGKSIGKK